MRARPSVQFSRTALYCRMRASPRATLTTILEKLGGLLMRMTLAVVVGCLALGSICTANDADAAIKRTTEIPAQSLAPALQKLVKDRDIQLVYRAELIADRKTGGATGELTAIEALGQLLHGTGLTYRYLDDKTITIVPTPTAPGAPAPAMQNAEKPAPHDSATNDNTVPAPQATAHAESSKSFWTRFRLAQAETGTTDTSSSSEGANTGKKTVALEEVTVTGSRIKGGSVASPLVQLSQDDMRLAGFNNLGEVTRSLPQNFGGGQSPLMIPLLNAFGQAEAGDFANQNTDSGSAMNLRGLGQDATLTLLNGTRLPFAGRFGATDISVIPSIAVERLDVLLDGASAIYGADAVGGVANVILRNHFDGAEFSARGGTATGGGYTQTQYSGLVGRTWSSGGIMAAYDFNRNTTLEVGDTDFFDYLIANKTMPLFPPLTQHSGVISGHQQIGERVELGVDAFWTRRDSLTSFNIEYAPFAYLGVDPNLHSIRVSDSTTKTWGVTPALTTMLPGDWSARVYGFKGKDDIFSDQHEGYGVPISTPVSDLTHAWVGYNNKSSAYGIESEGPVLDLPGGAARVSLGGGARKNDYLNFQGNPSAFDEDSPAATPGKGGIRDRFAFAEVNVPVVGEQQHIRGVRKLELNFAGRVDDYDRFNSGFIPKVGALWDITPDVTFKATWSKSFKAPLLSQQFETLGLDIARAFSYGAPSTTASDALVLHTFGGNRELKPERAKTWSAGLTFRPEAIRGLFMEFNWFDVEYTDRITQPIQPIAAAWTDPKYHDIVTWNPTAAQVQAAIDRAELIHEQLSGDLIDTREPYSLDGVDLTKVIAILPDNWMNISRQTANGYDFTVRYTRGGIALTSSVSHLNQGQREVVPGADKITVIGRSFFPAKTRARTSAMWRHAGFTSSTSLTYLSGVTSSIDLVQESASMVTVDQTLEYEFQALGDTRFSLAVMNVFNRAPPYSINSNNEIVRRYTPQFDSTNYSPLGRTVSLSLMKRFGGE